MLHFFLQRFAVSDELLKEIVEALMEAGLGWVFHYAASVGKALVFALAFFIGED